MPLQSFLVLLLFLFPGAHASAAAEQLHTKVLAASCAACHGTNGNSVGGTPVLAGLDAGYFTNQMLAFKQGTRASTVMHHHASGLTMDEIEHLADYYARQPRVDAQTPKKDKT
jgi:cytochrome c553